MGTYITNEDVLDRYPSMSSIGGASEINSAYIVYAENMVNGFFAGYFTIPFSSNNETAKDLAIDAVYVRAGNLKLKERESLRKELMKRMERIKDGSEQMVLSDGDYITTVGETVYSNTKDYTPVFGMSPIEYMEVDSSQVYDEESDRGNI